MCEDAGSEVEGDVIEALIDRLAAQAHAERKAMLREAVEAINQKINPNQRDRQSFAQLLRHARERIRKVTQK